MVLKTASELDLMHEANRIVHLVLDGIVDLCRPGVTTRELDQFAERTIRAAGGVPAFLNYRGYPATRLAVSRTVALDAVPENGPRSAVFICSIQPR